MCAGGDCDFRGKSQGLTTEDKEEHSENALVLISLAATDVPCVRNSVELCDSLLQQPNRS